MTNPPPRDPASPAGSPAAAPESPGGVPASAAPTGSGPAYPPPAPPGQPASPPSAGLPPRQPAPPTYDPTLLPVSAYTSDPPAPVQPGRTAIGVLAALLGLFVLASVTLGALYVRQGQESLRKSEQIAALEAANAGAQRQLQAAERDLRGADDDLAAARTERDAIAHCLTAIYDWWDALERTGGVTTPDTEQRWLEASRLCRVADQYL